MVDLHETNNPERRPQIDTVGWLFLAFAVAITAAGAMVAYEANDTMIHEAHDRREDAMHILWTIIIGFVAGVIAKLIYPGNKYEPTGYIWTTVLGIIGAFVATYLGQAVGWYQPDEGAGFIGAIVGAIIILTVWGFIAPRFERT
jgi:uncharacterized membrane protein YeaQ/YmgE (transglycosylase-associated protein family)